MFNCQHLWGDNSRKRVVRGCKQNDAHQASISNYVIDDVYCYAMSSCSCRYKAIASASIHMNRFHWDYLTAAKLSISPHENFWPKFLARSGRACLSLRCLRSWSQCPQALRAPTRSNQELRCSGVASQETPPWHSIGVGAWGLTGPSLNQRLVGGFCLWPTSLWTMEDDG